MTTTVSMKARPETADDAWTGFRAGLWKNEIDVRDFIQQNYEPYEGDGSFLASATPRTRKIWEQLKELFVEERKKGVLEISQGTLDEIRRTVQRGVDGALGQVERSLAPLTQPLDHAVSVGRLGDQHAQQQQVDLSAQVGGAHT